MELMFWSFCTVAYAYLESVGRYCAQIHAAAYQSYITYPIDSALPA